MAHFLTTDRDAADVDGVPLCEWCHGPGTAWADFCSPECWDADQDVLAIAAGHAILSGVPE